MIYKETVMDNKEGWVIENMNLEACSTTYKEYGIVGLFKNQS